ncbi:MAG: cupin domain-containing protein [Actinobacteria bacterium]|nr:cupin domain-containing protein [Actinomycetota bacterium]
MSTITHEEIIIGELAIRPRVEPEESGGSVAIHEFDVPVGAGLPLPHSHDAYEETIYGLAGTVTFTIEGKASEIGPGESVCIPRGAVHSFANDGEVDATALAIVTPGILGGDYFREVAAIVDAAAGGPPDLAAIGEVMRRHGLTPVA